MEFKDVYTDDSPAFAARQYPGCFSVAQVRERLNQPLPLERSSAKHWRRMQVSAQLSHAGIDCSEEMISVNSKNHYLPGCVCSKLHSGCEGAAQPLGSDSSDKSESTNCSISLEDLRNAAKAGCWFCSILYGGVKACPVWDASRSKRATFQLSMGIFVSGGGKEGRDCSVGLFTCGDPNLVFYTQEIEAEHSRCKVLQTKPETPRATDSRSMLIFARDSNLRCHQTHACGKAIPPSMPTRLLKIRINAGTYAINLVEGAACEPYVTLSHCWGKTPAATTTASTLEDRIRDIPWSVLTQTFKDAVALTEQLGYQYLWIDALCILQDSKEDWEVESATMHQVYTNCDLMLSADGAKDGSIGFFRGDQIWTESWEPLVSEKTQHGSRIRFAKAHHTFGKMLLMFPSEEECTHVYPLRTRAWCLQERFMAPRILHFGVDELHWECSSEACCQCVDLGYRMNEKMWQKRLFTDGCTVGDKASYWFNISNQYSERTLTKWTDRLPALSGLAKQFMASEVTTVSSQPGQALKFNQLSLGGYLAGLWSATLERGLCWQADYTPGKRVSTKDTYIAPSWSWASVSGPINWNWGENGTVATAIKIHDVSCVLAGSDPIGAVSGGILVISARIIDLRAYFGKKQVPDGKWAFFHHLEGLDPVTGKDAYLGCYRPDAADDRDGFEYYWAAADDSKVRGEDLAPLDTGDYHGVQMSANFVLVLRLSEGDEDVFRRVGSIENESDGTRIEKSRFFEGFEMKKISIL